ncbi:MAG: transposase [bacterium]|nr:transposase [bacterium]
MGDAALLHPVGGHPVRSDSYQRREPEQTVLYQAIAAHWPEFLERAEELGGLPRFVVREFEEYLRCGILAHGCLHLECRDCGHSLLVAFSCKRRGFCPSCIGRRMADLAVHLEEAVFPEVPVRHWVCSFPWGLRALLGYDGKLCAEFVRAFSEELSRSLRRRAKQQLGLDSMSDAHTGILVAIQRVDSALRLNVHYHVLALDGVYVRAEAGDETSDLIFHALPTPSSREVTEIAKRTALRVDSLLRAQGRHLLPQDGDDDSAAEPAQLTLDEPGLAACYEVAASGVGISGPRAGKSSLRLVRGGGREAPPGDKLEGRDEPVGEYAGINLYAKQFVHGRDRKQLERLCRYVTRPPVANDRLSLRDDGRLELAFKNVWKDGTRGIVLEPHDLITRLIAAVPPPRQHQVRYFGVLSSHSQHRGEIVPLLPDIEPTPVVGDQLALGFGEEEEDQVSAGGSSRKPWSWLMGHIFSVDLERCQRCGGKMRWIEAATTPEAVSRLLADHGLGPRAPPEPPPPTLGQLRLPFS